MNAYLRDKNYDFREVPKEFVQDTQGPYYLGIVNDNDLTNREIPYLRLAALSRMAKDDCVVKTHSSNRLVDWMPQIPPALTESAIYIVRDPRDVCVSLADHMGRSIEDTTNFMNRGNAQLIDDDVFAKRQLMCSWSDHVFSWVNGLQGVDRQFPVTVIRYEDMQADPDQTFKKVVEGLGYEFDYWRMKRALKKVEFKKIQADEQKHGFIERTKHQKRFFREGKTGAWRKALTEQQAGRIVADHHQAMKLLGYSEALAA